MKDEIAGIFKLSKGNKYTISDAEDEFALKVIDEAISSFKVLFNATAFQVLNSKTYIINGTRYQSREIKFFRDNDTCVFEISNPYDRMELRLWTRNANLLEKRKMWSYVSSLLRIRSGISLFYFLKKDWKWFEEREERTYTDLSPLTEDANYMSPSEILKYFK